MKSSKFDLTMNLLGIEFARTESIKGRASLSAEKTYLAWERASGLEKGAHAESLRAATRNIFFMNHLMQFFYETLVLKENPCVHVDLWIAAVQEDFAIRGWPMPDTNALKNVSGPAVRQLRQKGYIVMDQPQGVYRLGPEVSTWKAVMGTGRVGTIHEDRKEEQQ